MSGIYLNELAKLKSFSATVKGAKSSARIEIEFADPTELGYFMSSLQKLDAEQKAAAKPKKQLRIPHLSGGDQ